MIIFAALFVGCAEPQISPNVIYVPTECKEKMPADPNYYPEVGNRASVLESVLKNTGLKDEFIYELKATLRKCIK